MKKLILVLIVILSSSTIFAQTQKGKTLLSGGFGLQFISSNVKEITDGETDDEYTTNSFSINPSIAYFFADNLAIGFVGINTFTTEKEDGYKYKTGSLMLLPTAIYYFPMEGKIKPVVQIGAGLSSQTTNYIPENGENNKTSYTGLAFNFGGGFAYFINESISINFGLSYTRVNLTNRDDNKNKVKQGNLGSNIGLAMYF